MSWESLLKEFFRSFEIFLFGCFSKRSILMSPRACYGELNSDVFKQVGEFFSFRMLLRHLVKLGKVMLLKELVNSLCSGGM